MGTINLKQSITPIFNLLKLTFGIVPIVAGIDKFTNLLTHWEKYVSPGVADILPFAPHTFITGAFSLEKLAQIIMPVKNKLVI